MPKRGPKPSGEVNVPVFRRIPEDLVERVDAFLGKAIEARKAGNTEAIDNWFREVYGVDCKAIREGAALRLAKSDDGFVSLPEKEEDLPIFGAADKAQIKALLEDVDRLTKANEELEAKVQRVARMNESELVNAWIRKYDALKASITKGEYDQS